MRTSRLFLAISASATFLVTGLATAQHHQPSHIGNGAVTAGAAGAGTSAGPFGLAVYGAFQRMMHMQDYSEKVQLSAVMQAGATEAVGAASGLRGEITAIDGKLLLSYGTACPTCGHPGQDHATLLVSAKVSEWRQPTGLPTDLSGKALDDWIVAQAASAGLDTGQPFPIRMTGTLTSVKMHVIKGANPGFKGHGSGHAMADQVDVAAAKIDGEVIGFYAPPNVQGVITHPGEPFHYHWVDTGRTKTAHLDAFGMAKGSQLVLPAK